MSPALGATAVWCRVGAGLGTMTAIWGLGIASLLAGLGAVPLLVPKLVIGAGLFAVLSWAAYGLPAMVVATALGLLR